LLRVASRCTADRGARPLAPPQLVLHSVHAYVTLCGALLGEAGVVFDMVQAPAATRSLHPPPDDAASVAHAARHAARLAATHAAYVATFGTQPPARVWGAAPTPDDAPPPPPHDESASSASALASFEALCHVSTFSVSLVDYRGGAEGGPLCKLRGLTHDTDVCVLRRDAAAACGLSPAEASTLPLFVSGGAGALRDGVTLRAAGVAPRAVVVAVWREPWRSRMPLGSAPAELPQPARCDAWRGAPPGAGVTRMQALRTRLAGVL
jgi:hypothetical protein